MSVFAFEVRQWLKNPLLYVTMLLIAFFLGTQLEPAFWTDAYHVVEPPQPGRTSGNDDPWPYGTKIDTSQDEQMQFILRQMYLACHGNPVDVPALGGLIGRQVKLSDAQLALMRDAFAEMTGVSYADVDYATPNDAPFPVALAHSEFISRVEALNAALGDARITIDPIAGGSIVPKTYEDALVDYEALFGQDCYTRAYARYFCDYFGIALAIFPAFAAAFMLGRDRRSGAASLIGSRPIRGVSYVLGKYAAYVACLSAFVLFVTCIPTVGAIVQRMQGHAVDVLGYVKYSVAWLLPTVLVVPALSMFVSEAACTGIASIPVVIFWWMASITRFRGPYPFYASLIRFNSTNTVDPTWWPQIAANRLGMVAISVLLVLLTGWLYEFKRGRGGRYV